MSIYMDHNLNDLLTNTELKVFVTLVCKHTGFTFNHFDTLTSFKKMLKDPAFNNSFDIPKRVLIPKIGIDGELGFGQYPVESLEECFP